MKIKSLLLGSAAAMVAVSAANAADIVIPEPEMVEYVRVCDAAGGGYFYIPGSETCLKISGYVQFEATIDDDNDGIGNDDTLESEYEARLQFDAWRDTQYGALTTRIRLTADASARADLPGNDSLEVDRAYFDLAGLRIGVDASAFDYGFGGPADAYNDGGDEGATLRYAATFGVTTITVSLEDDSVADDFVPSIVAVGAFSVGEVSATVGFAYEEDIQEWSAKATATYDFGQGSIGAGVQYTDTPVAGSNYGTNYEWVLGADASFDATDAFELGLGFQYGVNQLGTTDDDWTIGALASYDITETLNTNLRVRYNDDDVWSARLRFRSSF